VGDVILMMQYAIYSVISPEGCASILWRSAEKAPDAADALGITSNRLKTLGLVDKIVPEPLGGAHRDSSATLQALKKSLAETLKQLQEKKPRQLVEERLERLMAYGKFKEATER
jgi:acetyl-CoA carboxylase carboxyl transferase subunit alpha